MFLKAYLKLWPVYYKLYRLTENNSSDKNHLHHFLAKLTIGAENLLCFPDFLQFFFWDLS